MTAWARPFRPRRDYKIRLTCGCSVLHRTHPLKPDVRYGCAAGLRHGYQLAWTAWTYLPTGQTRTNPLAPADNPPAPPAAEPPPCPRDQFLAEAAELLLSRRTALALATDPAQYAVDLLTAHLSQNPRSTR